MSLVQRALDPPGEALPDWKIFARVGRALGHREALGGYARYIAICPPGTPGARISSADAPLKKYSKPLHYDATAGMRIR